MGYGNQLYGTVQFGANASDTTPEAYSIDLMRYLPEYYQEVKEVKELQDTLGHEVGSLYYAQDDVLKQFFADTATWGLEHWEKELGLSSYVGKPLAQRRSRIISKLRGTGVVTVNLIKNVVASYSNMEVNVVVDNSNYLFTLELISFKGFPYGLDNLYETIETIKPAHLQANYQITSGTIDGLLFGALIYYGEEVRVYPYQITEVESSGSFSIALGQTQCAEIITINPRREA